MRRKYGYYRGIVITSWTDDTEDRKMKLVESFAYIDMMGFAWEAPAGTVIDGASIPKMFWSILGGPYEGPYRDASIIHDWLCTIKTSPWNRVHRLFDEMMKASKVPWLKRTAMAWAVYNFGPRWKVN